MKAAIGIGAGVALIGAGVAGVVFGMTSGATSAASENTVQDTVKEPAFLYEELRTPLSDTDRIEVHLGGKIISDEKKAPAGSKLVLRHVQPHTTLTITDGNITVPHTALGGGKVRSDRLAPARNWTVTATGLDGSTRTWVVHTKEAKNPYTANVNLDGGTWGVAAPLTVTFSTNVQNKDDVLNSITLDSGGKVDEVAWVWEDDQTLTARPATFWPGHTTYRLTMDGDSVQAQDNVWGSDMAAQWKTGAETKIFTNFANHTMVVKKDGKKTATYPISGGMGGWETLNGVKPISEKYDVKRLYNPDPANGWDVTVPWAMRLTYSGEFIHSAPWNGSIGYANTSHGCTNMTTSDAADLYSSVRVGDPVISKGGSGVAQNWDTWGGAWSYTWKQWKKQGTTTPVT